MALPASLVRVYRRLRTGRPSHYQRDIELPRKAGEPMDPRLPVSRNPFKAFGQRIDQGAARSLSSKRRR